MTTTLITPDFLADPTPRYRVLREAGPLHFSTEFFGGAWLLTRYEDVAWALKDPRLSARRTGGWLGDGAARQRLAPFQRLFARALLFQDAPDHGRLRQLMMPAFRPAGLAAIRAHAQEVVDELLGGIEDPARPFDLMETLARPLPARVMARLMGVDAPGLGDPLCFTDWSDDIAEFLGHPQPGLDLAQRAQRAALAMAAMFRRALALRRASPPAHGARAPDLLSLLLQGQAEGRVESAEELLAQCVMLLFAGHETTRHLLCNGAHALLGQPGAWRRLGREQDALLPSALRELLRYDSPVQYTGRRVAAAFTLHGRRFERGELLIPLIGAAHHDPAAYTEPGRLRLDRREAPHMAFGQGPHVCIGAALTYLEAEVAFGALLKRFPGLRLAQAGGGADAGSQRLANPLYRGWRRLMVVAAGETGTREAPAIGSRAEPATPL